jgi:hypothetical protein
MLAVSLSPAGCTRQHHNVVVSVAEAVPRSLPDTILRIDVMANMVHLR